MNPTKSDVSEKPTITDRLRIVTFPVIDPVVSFLAKYRLSPDVLTVVGMLAHFLFAYWIAQGQFLWAGVAMMLLAPLDALDGSLARKLGRKQGGFGAYLDSTLDRLAEIVLFGGFIYYYFMHGNELMMAVAYIAVTGSLMVSYSRGKAEALGYKGKLGLASRVERYFLLIALLILGLPSVAVVALAILTYVTVGQRMFSVWRQWLQEMEEEA